MNLSKHVIAVIVVIVTAAIASQTITLASHPAEGKKKLVAGWCGIDGKIDRLMIVRAQTDTEWLSFWNTLTGSLNGAASVDFDAYEIIGVVLPLTLRGKVMVFQSVYREFDDRVVLAADYSVGAMSFARADDFQSSYAVAILPKQAKKVFVELDKFFAEHLKVESPQIEAVSAYGALENGFPLAPLTLGGQCRSGFRPRESLQVFEASSGVVRKGEEYRSFRLAHVMAYAEDAVLKSGAWERGGEVHSRHVTSREVLFPTETEVLSTSFEVNAMDYTVTCEGKTYDLRQGNFILIELHRDGAKSVHQIPIVITKADDRYDNCAAAKGVFRKFKPDLAWQ